MIVPMGSVRFPFLTGRISGRVLRGRRSASSVPEPTRTQACGGGTPNAIFEYLEIFTTASAVTPRLACLPQ